MEIDFERRHEIVVKAFKKACQFLREHPPEDTCEHIELVHLVLDGKSDPEGTRWMRYFLTQVLDEEMEE